MNSQGVVIGFAGKCCAGKDVACNYFLEKGFEDVNVDRIGHLALEFKSDVIAEEFGADSILSDGTVDRAKLGSIVFGDKRARGRLEEMVHPWMTEQVRLAVAEYRESPGDKPGLVINAALLFPMGLNQFCDVVIWIDASPLARIQRARRRDQMTVWQLYRRLRSQRRLEPQDIGSRADMITVKNSGTVTELYKKLEEVEAQIWNRTGR